MTKKYAGSAIAIVLATGLAVPAALHAEAGDYGFWDTLYYLIWPAAADNPVAPAQRSGDYPLRGSPAGFADGFSPGLYGSWQTVQLAPGTGAVCSDGSPYKFFVNRVPGTSNTLFYVEGGGACWDYATCSGKDRFGAINTNGIPDNYMSLLSGSIASLMSPLVTRISPFGETVKTQNWNMVFLPYCTGDVHGGDKVAVYANPEGADAQPLVYYHNGLRNQRAVIAWLKDHLQRPAQLLVTGSSAGGFGAEINYHHVRRDIAPDKAFLLNDSGPLFDAPSRSNPTVYPSVPFHDTVRKAWNLAAPLSYLARDLPGLDQRNFVTLHASLAQRWPDDRMGLTSFWQDDTISGFSYRPFFADIEQAPDSITRQYRQLSRFRADMQRTTPHLDRLSNFGYYLPQYRNLIGSHTVATVDFQNGDIQEKNLQFKDFLNNVLDGSGAVMKASEVSDAADHARATPLHYLLINEFGGF